MDLAAHLAKSRGTWRPAAPASRDALAHLLASSQVDLPRAYLDLLALSNGGEGDLAVEPGWISLWAAENVLLYNAEYEIAHYAPGLFGFGSNGGGELLAIDTRSGPPYPIVMIPFIPMALEEAKAVSDSFESLITAIGTPLPAA